MRIVNLGIVAHVDAGKTSLTERLLYDAGVIDAVGSVDAGSTQTDSLALERARGITIKSAVVSFAVGDTTVNLIDTPGHPDFIAEVERSLAVLDGAVLVVSAVEGVQAQTRVLMRTLRRLRIPTLLFVNKVDRAGAQVVPLLERIRQRLTPAVVPMGSVRGPGTRDADVTTYGPADPDFTGPALEVLTKLDDALLAVYVEAAVSGDRLRAALAAQTRCGTVCPVFFGSAITGAGVPALTAAITELLPAADADPDAPLSGTVFKVERGPIGEKVAYLRLFAGTVRVRERLRQADGTEEKVTALEVFDRGRAAPRGSVVAGQIAKVRGLSRVRIGDPVGARRPGVTGGVFAPPTLETVVLPVRPGDKGALHAALSQLTEQDPLIDLRQGEALSVSLYGEVQKEVIEATLADEYGIPVTFRETTTICVERVVGTGAAVEFAGHAPFLATVGLRVDPAPVGSGVRFRLEVELGSLPLAYFNAVEKMVVDTLRQGLYGWSVPDCTVSMTHSGYVPPLSTAGDFRNLTPLVLMDALRRAGTRVCEPMHRFHLDVPADTSAAVLPVLARLRAIPRTSRVEGTSFLLDGAVPAGQVHALQRALPSLTRGEGVLESAFDHYAEAPGTPPARPRWDHNPANRKEYLLHVVRRV